MRRVQASAPLGLLSVLILTGASAWACVPQPFLLISPQASGPVGGEVTVEGTDFGSGDVEIRWDGVQGPLLAEGAGPDFSITVAVPDTSLGLHSVVGFIRDGNGNVTQKGATSFEVREAGGTTSSRSTEETQARGSEAGDDSDLSAAGIGAIAVGGLVVATLGGLVGAAISSRRARSTPPGLAPESS